MHTCSLYVYSEYTYSLYVSKDERKSDHDNNQLYPVIMTSDVAATAAFYVGHFGFRALFEADWYVHLQDSGDPSVNLAILDGQHETIPRAGEAGSAACC